MNKNYWILLVFICFYSCSNTVKLDDEKWWYEGETLNISFVLKNHGDTEIYRKVNIVTHRRRKVGPGALVNDVIGKKFIKIYLQPHEEKEISDTVELILGLKPSVVTFNHSKLE